MKLVCCTNDLKALLQVAQLLYAYFLRPIFFNLNIESIQETSYFRQ